MIVYTVFNLDTGKPGALCLGLFCCEKEKSIDPLLYDRLQLPATSSDDTLVAYSTAGGKKQRGEGNPSAWAQAGEEGEYKGMIQPMKPASQA